MTTAEAMIQITYTRMMMSVFNSRWSALMWYIAFAYMHLYSASQQCRHRFRHRLDQLIVFTLYEQKATFNVDFTVKQFFS